MSLPKSAGEPASAVRPRSASLAANFGSASAVLTSLLTPPRRMSSRPRPRAYFIIVLIFSMIGFGVA